MTVSAIRHGDLAFHNPLAPERVDEAIAQLGLGRDDRVFDVGCGPGELLIRIVERYGCVGIGIDAAEGQIAEARRRAAIRGVELDFVVGDAGLVDLGEASAAACVGSSHALGGTAATLEHLAGAHTILLGDGFWTRRPDPAYLEALGGASEDELTDLAGLLHAGEPFGFRPVWVATATPAEWERYEWTLVANGDRFTRADPDHPLAAEVLAANEQTVARLSAPGGADTLGFALVVLRGSRPA